MNTFLCLFIATTLAFAFAGCDNQPGDEGNAKPASEAPADDLSKRIEALTGAHTRIVWSAHVDEKPDKSDKHGNGSRHQIWGIDTRDGAGIRRIVDKVANYTRPMLTPDGRRIVYTDKRPSKKSASKGTRNHRPSCYVMNFDGSNRKALTEAYADDVWADPEAGTFWVYACEKFKKGDGSAAIF